VRTGEDYRESLRDGRKVWILGEGPVEDLTTHPITRPMVDAYARWYDRHTDPAWADVLLTPPDTSGPRRPIAYEIPRTAEDLRRLSRSISQVSFLSAGNVTHTPGYGALIALGLLDMLKTMDISSAEIANAAAHRDEIARTGRFLTFSAGGAPIGFRFRPEEAERAAIRVVDERDDGLVISGKVGMHTSSPFADDVFVSGGTKRSKDDPNVLWFIIPVSAEGVRVIARKAAARHAEPELSPLTHQFDELDAQLWLDEVFIPYERVFTSNSPLGSGRPPAPGGDGASSSSLVGWLLWHQHLGWLARLEFSLGLALAASDVMGFKSNPAQLEQIIDMVAEVQTARTCTVAAECDPEPTLGGFLMPRQLHLASASLHFFQIRQRMAETLRRLPGSSLVVAPTPADFDDPKMAADLEQAFGGGGYSARQRSALLNLIWDHVSSALDGRESTYEMHANGGVGAWRMRLRTWFKDYNALANGVLRALDVEMPELDVSGVGVVTWPSAPGGAATPGRTQAVPKIDRATRGAGQWLSPPAAGPETPG
jgi:4-hydroxyphenylacetate 3-monooxygenase